MVRPKDVANMVGNSLIQVARLPFKVAVGVADAGKVYAAEVDRELGTIQTKMPEDPAVLITSALGIAADTLQLVGNAVTPVASAVGETARGINTQFQTLK